MAKITRKSAQRLLEEQCAVLFLTLGTEPCYQIDGHGVVPRKIALELTAECLFEAMPSQRKGAKPLVPQEDGLFPGFSQTWKMGS